MALLELGGKKFTIPVGEVTLGSDAGCAISLAGAAVLPRHALLQGEADGQVIIRKASPAADVLINGVRLGAEPTPLLHGDKVEVGGSSPGPTPSGWATSSFASTRTWRLPLRLPPLRRGRPLARRPCPQPHLRGRNRRAGLARRRLRPARRTVSAIPCMVSRPSYRLPPDRPRAARSRVSSCGAGGWSVSACR